jgi:ribosomal protein S20
MKDYKKAIEEGQTEEAAAKLPMVYKRLDKAAKTNLIKPNKANRLKSRLTKRLKGVSAVTPTTTPIEQEDQTPAPEL